MEQRHFSDKSLGYHETQARKIHADIQALVPEAACVNDRFLLDLDVPETLLHAPPEWLVIARETSHHLLPDSVTTSRLATLSCYDRLSTALTVAQVSGIQRLCNHYAARLTPQPGPDSSRESNLRLTQITQYARQLASSPSLINTTSRTQLAEVGLTESDRVTFNQIIGFVGFQARVIAVLQVLNGQPVRLLPGLDIQQDAAVERFTTGKAQWQPDIQPSSASYLRPEQANILRSAQSVPALTNLASGLLEDDVSLSRLTGLAKHFPENDQQAIVALISARINGSSDSFHRLASTSQDATLVDAIRNAERALLAWSHNHPRKRAIIQAVQVLIRSPAGFSSAQLSPMIETGLSESDAWHILSAAAFFGWLNRLEIGLGEPR